MTTELEGVKRNPTSGAEDLRHMATGVNRLVEVANRGYSEYPSKSITASESADDTATIIYASSTGGTVNVTLQPAADVKHRIYGLMKTDSSTNAVAFQASSTAELINGSTSLSTTTQYNIDWIHSNGTQWYEVS